MKATLYSVFAWILLATALIGADPAQAATGIPAGRYTGVYVCGQGPTQVVIDVGSDGASGTFSFVASRASGSYTIAIVQVGGNFDLRPLQWISRPGRYQLASARVQLSDGRMDGRVLMAGCGEIHAAIGGLGSSGSQVASVALPQQRQAPILHQPLAGQPDVQMASSGPCDSPPDKCINVANRYYTGNGVQADPKRAMSMYQYMCDVQQYRVGCYNVANSYEDGIAVPKNMAMAEKYYGVSCQQGYEHACAWLDRLKEKQRSAAPSPAQLKEARRALLADSGYWGKNVVLDKASLRDDYFHTIKNSAPRVHIDFSYSGGQAGWADIQLDKGVAKCIEMFDSDGSCFEARSKEGEEKYRREHPNDTMRNALMGSGSGSSGKCHMAMSSMGPNGPIMGRYCN